MCDIKPIRTRRDHAAALKEINRLWNAKKDSPEGDRLEILGLLVEDYEKKHFPIDPPDPIGAIEFHLEQMGLDRKALEPLIGSRKRVSEIMTGKRPLTLSMMRRLNQAFGISMEILAQEPEKLTKRVKTGNRR